MTFKRNTIYLGAGAVGDPASYGVFTFDSDGPGPGSSTTTWADGNFFIFQSSAGGASYPIFRSRSVPIPPWNGMLITNNVVMASSRINVTFYRQNGGTVFNAVLKNNDCYNLETFIPMDSGAGTQYAGLGNMFDGVPISGSTIPVGAFDLVFSSQPTAGQKLGVLAVNGRLVYIGGGGDQAGGGSANPPSLQNPVTGYIFATNAVTGYAIGQSSGIHIGTTDYAILSISSANPQGSIVFITTGANEVPFFDMRIGSTVLNSTFIAQGPLISNSSGPSTFNQGVVFNANNDASVNGNISILSGFAPGAAGASQQYNFFSDASSNTVSFGTNTRRAATTIYNDGGRQRYSAMVTTSATDLSGLTTNYTMAWTNTGHFAVGGGSPTISSCGTSPAGACIGCTDMAGTVQVGGTAPTACTITFQIPFRNIPGNPTCTVSDNSTTISASVTSINNTALVTGFGVGGLAGGLLYYNCQGIRE